MTIAGATVLSGGPRADSRPAVPAISLAGLAVPAGGLTPHDTDRFSLLGVTWADPAATVDGAVQVRTRAVGTHRWTDWQTLEADGSNPGDARGATDPLWVGASDGVQARVTGASRPLPAGLRVELINPDATATRPLVQPVPVPVAAVRPLAAAVRPLAVAAARTVAMPTRPVPRMITRAGWGADESMVKGVPEYAPSVQAFFVHHTATGNGYRCADSPSIVRGIQAYQVRSKGWDDIGYNFLIDKCGTIFEGRVGGVGRPVIGAHTLGFNNGTSALAVIGNYDAAGVSATVRTAIATVAAYKLGAYGFAPNGVARLVSAGSDRFAKGSLATLNRISGHRDTGRTECPGNSLYAQLGQIRAIAGAAPYGLRLVRMTGTVRRGSVSYTKGLIRPLWTVQTPSALINRFEVWVDGRLTLAAPGTHRAALLRLPAGGHTVTVRALHLSGRATMLTTKVLSDPYAPVFTSAPDVALRTGSLDGSVPIRLNWAATDVNGLSAVALLRPTAVQLGIAAHSRTGTLPPGRATTFTLRATDRAGNSRIASVTRTPVVVSEAVAERTGDWRTLRNPGYLGGVALGSPTAGSTATWSFTGRSATLAVGRGAASGRARIYVDGDDQGFVDLRSVRTVYRQAVWARSWGASGTHTVRVVVEATTGRTGAVLDGLIYLR
ncbi:N-acetylmuramoyl-L-alanine amidase [Micromonosporaceae bacterium Da 78-11]